MASVSSSVIGLDFDWGLDGWMGCADEEAFPELDDELLPSGRRGERGA